MKITLNIDDALLARVVASTGAKTKTEAINAALAEIDRRNKLVALLSEEITMTPKEWANAIDESAWDEGETESARVAEEPSRRDRKPRSR
jgi:Arc/MetJ family transcription regulator